MEKRKSAQPFRDLVVWQKGHQLALGVYSMTKSFPKEEMYGSTSQVKRSSVSVAANIAEGFKKKGKADKLRYFNIAQGSLSETEYYLILAKDLEYYDTEVLMMNASEVGKLLESYINACNN